MPIFFFFLKLEHFRIFGHKYIRKPLLKDLEHGPLNSHPSLPHTHKHPCTHLLHTLHPAIRPTAPEYCDYSQAPPPGPVRDQLPRLPPRLQLGSWPLGWDPPTQGSNTGFDPPAPVPGLPLPARDQPDGCYPSFPPSCLKPIFPMKRGTQVYFYFVHNVLFTNP